MGRRQRSNHCVACGPAIYTTQHTHQTTGMPRAWPPHFAVLLLIVIAMSAHGKLIMSTYPSLASLHAYTPSHTPTPTPTPNSLALPLGLTRPTKVLGFVRAFSSSASHIAVSLSQQRQQQYQQQQQQQQQSSSRRRAPVSSSRRSAATTTSSFPSSPRKEIFDIPPFEPTPATAKDLACIEGRQLLHPITCAGGPRQLCSHSFPQAFVFHPSKTTFNSGIFRLCCPLLVKAVDEYEAQGMCGWSVVGWSKSANIFSCFVRELYCLPFGASYSYNYNCH
jgi:hypothetical protein